MKKNKMKSNFSKYLGLISIALMISACGVPHLIGKTENTAVPDNYNSSSDTVNSAFLKWNIYFTDTNLIALIDTALKNNQELNMILQEIAISKNEVQTRKGEYLPFVNLKAGAGADKVSRHTRDGAVEATTDIEPGKEFPEPLPDYMVGAYASWEVDIWKKLRNAKESAVKRYLSSVEGQHFMVTNLIAEIANSYYELLALDKQLDILEQNITIQSNALKIVKLQKQAAKVTELAVKRFEAQVLNTRSLKFDIKQQIVETENRINFLVGRYPQTIKRNVNEFDNLVPNIINTGIPAQLLENRPDIKQAELELIASKLDVKVARAQFYPSLGISAGLGLQAFNPKFIVQSPESMLYGLVGDLTAPLINRNAIKAAYSSANARQIQAVYAYEQTILSAYIEVVNQLAMIENFESKYDLKVKEVEALTQSVTISNSLFKSARADYMEVLLTQRDALESRFELVETRKRQMNATVLIYQAMGGGWR